MEQKLVRVELTLQAPFPPEAEAMTEVARELMAQLEESQLEVVVALAAALVQEKAQLVQVVRRMNPQALPT